MSSMKRTKPTTGNYYEGIPANIPTMGDEKLSIEWSDITGMMSESLVALDFQRKNLLSESRTYVM